MQDACTVGSYIIPPQKFFMTDPNTNTIQPDLTVGTGFKPDKGGANPNYSVAGGYGGVNGYFYSRKFYSTTNLTKNIANFKMTFTGDSGTSANFNTALIDSKLRVYIRRINSPIGGTNSGADKTPFSLHGVNGLAAGNLDGLPSNVDGGAGFDTAAFCSPNKFPFGDASIIDGTFGSYPAWEGFYADIGIFDDTIEIDTINVTLIFNDLTTESSPVA